MGLFSRHKNVEDAPLPPTLKESISSGNSNSMAELGSDLSAPPVLGSQRSNLTPPSIPGGSLDEIKSEVMPSSSLDETPESLDIGNDDRQSMMSDDLFDMFGDDDLQSSDETKIKEKPTPFEMEDSTVDTNMSRSDSLNFMGSRGGHTNNPSKDSCFLTTNQFKTLLEIVEQVKSRVKDSTEVHLRLLDIKSEEDIEYENLRKNFQNMEDKLYELDNILFDK